MEWFTARMLAVHEMNSRYRDERVSRATRVNCPLSAVTVGRMGAISKAFLSSRGCPGSLAFEIGDVEEPGRRSITRIKRQCSAQLRTALSTHYPRFVLPKSCKFSQIKSSTLLHNISPPRRTMECRVQNVPAIKPPPWSELPQGPSLFLARNHFARNNLRLALIDRNI